MYKTVRTLREDYKFIASNLGRDSTNPPPKTSLYLQPLGANFQPQKRIEGRGHGPWGFN